MIRNETFQNGLCIYAEIIDMEAGTYTVEKHGEVIEGPRPLTSDERVRWAPFPPMEPAGALATLLVVEGVLPIEDVARSVGTVPEHLVHEAEAWGL